ncbi:MAG: SDR family oxidoreductase [Pirellulaceae bacterium]|nr:SDR family oxidoreductase [Pirellulaceae bacterium]
MSESKPSASYLIIGASGGIGSALSQRLRSAGHRVFLASRESERLQTLANDLNAPARSVDATCLSDVQSCFEQGIEEFGSLDGVVNCVGSVLLKPAHLTSEEEWQDTLRINLTSAFATVRGAAKTMLKKGGSVVLMSSAAAQIGLPSHEAIAAAKAGVIGLAKSAAASYAGRGLRFNVVAPGLVKTPLTAKIWQSERSSAASVAMHPVARLGTPTDIASMIDWLLQAENSWVTGEVFSIDGGLSSVRAVPRSGNR